MRVIKEQTIKWSPLTDKHIDYIQNSDNYQISIAEGAIRSGKTIDNCIIAAKYFEVCRDRLHLATGSVLRNAKLNIGDCNGFGLEHLFRGRCRWGKYKDNEALYINTQTGEKVVVFAGGGHSDSYKGILGNSYGLWIATEINEHFDSEDSKISFIKVAMGRQLAAQQPKILWDLNPSNPNATIYTQFIDLYCEQNLCNYQHFTIYDNGSLTPERIKEIEQRYVPGTIWHTRDILGQRCVAEGVIYRYFAENKDKFFVKTEDLPGYNDETRKPEFMQIIVGADWGGNKSYHAFCATGVTYDYKIYALASIRHKATDTDADFVSRKFNEFVEFVKNKYGEITDGYGDSEDQTIKNTVSNKGEVYLRNSVKNKIKDRIDALMFLIVQSGFFYTEDCETLVKAICTAVWDSKKDKERLDDGTSDIDTLDAFEYSWEYYINKISRY